MIMKRNRKGCAGASSRTLSVILVCVAIYLIVLINYSNSVSDAGNLENVSTTEQQVEHATISTTQTKITTEVTTQVKATTESPKKIRKKFKESCREVKYKDIMRNPDDYIGENIKCKVYVYEALCGGLFSGVDDYYGCYLLDEDGNKNYNRFAWILDYRDKSDKTYFKILDEDVVMVYGTFDGLKDSKNYLSGSKSEDFGLNMKYAELISE